jgi:hypothetical protein
MRHDRNPVFMSRKGCTCDMEEGLYFEGMNFRPTRTGELENMSPLAIIDV